MAAVVGTPSVQVWGTTANPAGQSVTVETGSNAAVWSWSYFAPTNGAGLASVTLNGNAPDQTFEVVMVSATFEQAVGFAIWYDPTTGSQTLDPAWDAAPTDGPTSFFTSISNADTAGWRDADGGNTEGTGAISVTLTTVSGDLVLKHDARFNAALPGTTASWTSVQTQTNNNSLSARLSTIVATGTTQVATAENEDYSGMAAIAIPDGGGAAASILRQMMNYHGG